MFSVSSQFALLLSTSANHYPAKEIIKSFHAITGAEGNFSYNFGWERIPENWYKVPNDYGLVSLNLDLVGFISKYPELAR